VAADAAAREGEWRAVRLTEARQVHALMGDAPDDWPAAEVGVRDRYRVLTARSPSAAVQFLAHALPRLEAVAWAARALEDAARHEPPSPRARHAMDASLRWLGERSDAHRRAAGAAAENVGKPVAERFLAQAVFYAGGSIAAPDQAPVMPPDHATARYVAAAISQLAHRSPEPTAAFAAALALGEAIATHGLQAVAR